MRAHTLLAVTVVVLTAATTATASVTGEPSPSPSPPVETRAPSAETGSSFSIPEVSAASIGVLAGEETSLRRGRERRSGRDEELTRHSGRALQVEPQEPGEGNPEEPTAGPAPSDPAGSNVTVRLRANGDAEWVVRVRSDLSDPDETRAFRRLGTQYETGRAEVGPSIVPFERAVAAAGRSVDREMSLSNVRRSARIENGTGYLTLRFTWRAFAEERTSRIRVGDAFRTPQGSWLPGLAAEQSFTIVAPPGYGVNSAPIGPENGTLRWVGPEEFEPGYLTVTYRRGLQARTTQTTAAPPDDSEAPLLPVAGVAALGVGLAVAFYARFRGLSLPGNDGETTVAAETDGGDGAGGTATTGGSDPLGADSGGSPESVAGGEATDTGADATSEIDEELLSDEERVERLLDANNGRMRQAAIVTETRWSNAKVSQLLSAMDRADRIDKLRIGRENLISLPEGKGEGKSERERDADEREDQ